ncbi:MAG: hypothetical protein HY22_13450 [[Candidatus Thermochlorobacteriaceae] bacterium GBChlB]|jgi:hypothetical protein|nr:MAG: hypothetical protein HY22_13450 [[Candidatus Thermochlorobacteriaceae] bacterium GBChlB]
MNEERYFQNGNAPKNGKETDDEKIILPEKGSIGSKIRARNQTKGILGGFTFNEVAGYGFAVMFLILAFVVYSQLGSNDTTRQYGLTMTAVLVLYAAYRFVKTRSWTTQRKRREEITRQREAHRIDDSDD